MTRNLRLRPSLSFPLILVVIGALGVGCAPKLPPPPSQFADQGRLPTGDNQVEYRIEQAARLAAITTEEREALAKKLLRGSSDPDILNDYVGATVGQGHLGEAIDLLHQLALRKVENKVVVVNALNLAMGQLQWKACAAMTESYLRLRMDRGVFLVRALCLERSGDPVEAEQNFWAAMSPRVQLVGEIDPVTAKALFAVLGERGGSRPGPPASDEVVARFERSIVNAGVVEKLFLAHLLNRFDVKSLKVGNINWGSLSRTELKTVILSRARAYRYCYQLADAESSRRSRPAGHSTFQFLVGPLGEIQKITVAESRWMKAGEHPQALMFNECIISQLDRLVFPRPMFSRPVPARHKVSFQPD
jgi:hypothetical protein